MFNQSIADLLIVTGGRKIECLLEVAISVVNFRRTNCLIMKLLFVFQYLMKYGSMIYCGVDLFMKVVKKEKLL